MIYFYGMIVAAHGIKGEISLHFFEQYFSSIATDMKENVEKFDINSVLFDNNAFEHMIDGAAVTLEFHGQKRGGKLLLASIKGVNSIEEAQRFIGKRLFIRATSDMGLELCMNVAAKFIGFYVLFEQKIVGIVIDVKDFGASPLLAIKRFDVPFERGDIANSDIEMRVGCESAESVDGGDKRMRKNGKKIAVDGVRREFDRDASRYALRKRVMLSSCDEAYDDIELFKDCEDSVLYPLSGSCIADINERDGLLSIVYSLQEFA